MNAAETIAAAIEKLERQRDAYYAEGEEVWRAEHHDSEASLIFNQDDLVIAMEVSRLDADLIVTLHRTIDAQIGLLREELVHVKNTRLPLWRATVLDLARAILGETA